MMDFRHYFYRNQWKFYQYIRSRCARTDSEDETFEENK